MDRADATQIKIERFGPADLAGAMLRKSYARRPNRSVYWPPARAIVAAALTAGLWPTGVLIYRLWLYADHQGFRAGELVRWLAEPNGNAAVAQNAWRSVNSLKTTTAISLIALAFWVVELLAVCALVATNLEFGRSAFGFSFPDPHRSRIVFALIASLGIAAFLQIFAVMNLSLKMRLLCARCRELGLPINLASVGRDLPGWSLWPMALAFAAIVPVVLRFPWAALWIVSVAFSLLASEVQRGYITVADRRLRIEVARAIGRVIYPAAKRR